MVSSCSSFIFSLTQQVWFLALFGKLKTHKIQELEFLDPFICPIFYFLQSERNTSRSGDRDCIFIAPITLFWNIFINQKKSTFACLFTSSLNCVLNNSVYKEMLLKVHCKFLKNCSWKIAYILSGENGYYDLRKKPIQGLKNEPQFQIGVAIRREI